MSLDLDRLCGFCLEEHRGACAHPDCPIAYTGGLTGVSARARSTPSPTRPSVAGGEPARRVHTPEPGAPAAAPSRRHIATQPSVHDAVDPPTRGPR